jgi:hypothetical protein
MLSALAIKKKFKGLYEQSKNQKKQPVAEIGQNGRFCRFCQKKHF